jgi:antitoxin VapB
MALNIKSEVVDRLARDLARLTGKSITQAVEDSLRAELDKAKRQTRRSTQSVKEQLLALGEVIKSMPVRDPRSADEILGYDDNGVPR